MENTERSTTRFQGARKQFSKNLKFSSFTTAEEAGALLRQFRLLTKSEYRLRDSSYQTVFERFTQLKDLLELALRNHQELGTNAKAYFDSLVDMFDNQFRHVEAVAVENESRHLHRTKNDEMIATLFCLGVKADLYDYMRRCRNHDWHYDYSDDINVWRAGRERYAKLKAEADEKGQAYQDVLTRCSKLAFERDAVFSQQRINDPALVGTTVPVIFFDNINGQTLAGGKVLRLGNHVPPFSSSSRDYIVIEVFVNGRRHQLLSYGYDDTYGQHRHFRAHEMR